MLRLNADNTSHALISVDLDDPFITQITPKISEKNRWRWELLRSELIYLLTYLEVQVLQAGCPSCYQPTTSNCWKGFDMEYRKIFRPSKLNISLYSGFIAAYDALRTVLCTDRWRLVSANSSAQFITDFPLCRSLIVLGNYVMASA